MADKPIGDLNGKWSLLFKAALTIVPIGIAWGAWISITMFRILIWQAATDADRFTIHDAATLRDAILQSSSVHSLSGHPPLWVVKELEGLRKDIDKQAATR